jgi:hypothetical protein
MVNKFLVGDKVRTNTHARYQKTQQSLNNLEGKVIGRNEHSNVIVLLEDKPTWGPIEFSPDELCHLPNH